MVDISHLSRLRVDVSTLAGIARRSSATGIFIPPPVSAPVIRLSLPRLQVSQPKMPTRPTLATGPSLSTALRGGRAVPSSGLTLQRQESELLGLERLLLFEIHHPLELSSWCCSLRPPRLRLDEPPQARHASFHFFLPVEVCLWLQLLSLVMSSARGPESSYVASMFLS